MKFIFLSSVLLLAVTNIQTASASGFSSRDINSCPPLSARSKPNSVHDLRADDIKAVASMGDSITAGMVGVNINTEYLTSSQFKEYRGLSWISGGAPNVNSLVNYVKHFSSQVQGASRGIRKARICKETFFCLEPQHDFDTDHLNAAQSGATSFELHEQVDYLAKYLGPGTPLADEWKLLTIFVGYNDLSLSCTPGRNASSYKAAVKSTIQKLANSIDYTFINLVGLTQYNEAIHLTDSAPGYRKYFQNSSVDVQDYECYCCKVGNFLNDKLGNEVVAHNNALKELADEMSLELMNGDKNVTVAFQPMNTDMKTVPYTSISNCDGFHPNVNFYSYSVRKLWNQIYRSKDTKDVSSTTYDTLLPIDCPTEKDRLMSYYSKASHLR